MLARALLCAAVAAVLNIGPASAADRPNPITAYTHDIAAMASGGAGDQLVARAEAQGEIRVIVGLNLAMRDEGTLSPGAAAAQVRQLQSVQDRVIQRVVGATDQSAVRWTFIPYMSLFVTAFEARRLLADPDVAVVEEDVAASPLYEPSITVPHADQVVAQGFSGKGYTIAIIDTGVDKTHPMLTGKVVAEGCYSTNNKTKGLLSLCPGGVPASTKAGSAAPCPSKLKGCDHGTHVASIAAGRAVTTGGKRLTGVAPGASVIAMKVFTRVANCGTDPSPCIRSFATDQISALQRVYALRGAFKIIAVNMSLGGGAYSSTCDTAVPAETKAIANLRAVGIAVTIASGNDSYNGYIAEPACISSAFAIGNSTNDDLAEYLSDNSSLIKLLAPGTNITAAVPGGFGTKSGTSMAAPYVAGAFAALKSAKPDATMALMLTALQCSGKMIIHREVPGGDPEFLPPPRPRVDLLGALDFLKYPASGLRKWDFNKVAEGLDWTPFFGTWAAGAGAYKQIPLARYWAVTSVASCDKASTVTAGIYRTDVGGQEPAWTTGVIVRGNPNYKAYTVSGYWMAYNRCHRNNAGNCTGIPTDPRGQASIWRLDNFNLINGTGVKRLLCYKATPIANGQTNLRIVVNGSHYAYYVNGDPICSITDGTYATGRDMIAAYDNGVTTGQMEVTSFAIQSANAPTAGAPLNAAMDPRQSAPPGALTGSMHAAAGSGIAQ